MILGSWKSVGVSARIGPRALEAAGGWGSSMWQLVYLRTDLQSAKRLLDFALQTRYSRSKRRRPLFGANVELRRHTDTVKDAQPSRVR